MPMRSMSVSLPNKSPLQDFRHSIGCLSGTELPSSALSQADVIPLTGEYWAVSANAYRWRLSFMPQVVALYRYPVKGFTPETCEVVNVLDGAILKKRLQSHNKRMIANCSS